MDRDKYRRLFVDEARENLRALNNELVALEAAMQAGAASDEAQKARARAMDAAFRTAHSLKGMAAAMGYEVFAQLAHKMEDLADLARQGRSLPPEAFDLLLEGSDVLEGMVERIAEGKEQGLDALDLPARLDAAARAVRGGGAPAPAPADAAPAVPPPTAPAPPPQPARHGLLAARVRIAADAPLPQVRAFMAVRALSALPGFVESSPPADAIKAGGLPADRVVVVRFDPATADAAKIEATAKAAQGVAEVEIGSDAPKPPPAEEGAAAAAGAATTAAGDKGEEDRTVRVRTAILDEFIDSVGELLLARSRLRALATRYDSPELGELVDEVERLTRDLHDRVVAARMTPLSFLTGRLPRVVRDLARAAKKPVELVMEGTEIELDRAILDELNAPLIHMLRNAVDHAHEGPEKRRAAGKPEAMKLAIRASRDRDQVLLELEDDGGGMDPAALKARAIERGLIDPAAAAAMSDAAAYELVCAPGFSTAAAVSETSGRGVGMDVVKATLERLGGVLRISSKKGKGTTFTLQLPLTVAIIQVLVVEAGRRAGQGEPDAYAIPIARVEHAVDLDEGRVATAHGRAYMKDGDALVPLYDLSKELGFEAPERLGAGTAILVGRGADVAAIRVERVLGQEEVVAKPLGRPLSSFSFLAGATLLADGRAAFILEPAKLLAAARVS